MKVDFYYKGALSSYKVFKDLVKKHVQEKIPKYEINYIPVEDEESAKRFRVPGLPTVRFNGRDIEKEKRFLREFNDKDRKYRHSDGREKDYPPEEMVIEAITEYINDSATFHIEVKGAKKGDTPIC
ncbi:MAG: hypothetical protein PHV06_08395 [bacterium]|nr:hypothetical protein [bacterium]